MAVLSAVKRRLEQGKKLCLFLLITILIALVVVVESEIPETGLCDILIFVPFTYRGYELPFYTGNRRNNLGFSHMAAALLAAKHFNDRDVSVVPELADPTIMNCPYRFDFNETFVYDTEIFSQEAARKMNDHIIQQRGGEPPCSVVGAYFDQPARELSILASTYEIPFASYRVLDPTFTMNSLYPYTVQTNGVSTSFSNPLAEYLTLRGRTDNIAFLVAGNTESVAMADVFTRTLRAAGNQTFSVQYLPRGLVPAPANEDEDGEIEIGSTTHIVSLKDALQQIKDVGFRTIVVIPSESDIGVDIPIMAEEAERLQMNTGEYFWIHFFLPGTVHAANSTEANDLVRKFFRGSASLDYTDKFIIDKEQDAFLQSWRAENSSFLDLVREKNPIPEGEPGYYEADENYFQTVHPEPGASFLYDSVMSVGIGACLQHSPGTSINGSSHLVGSKDSDFAGASGKVVYGNGPFVRSTGVREFATGMYAARNILPPGSEKSFVITELLDQSGSSVTIPPPGDSAASDTWISIEEFIFANGQTTGPQLRDTPEQNYLSPSVRIAGLTFMCSAIGAALAAIVWIFLNRKSQVVTAAQPGMLLVIMCGAIVQSITILCHSFDESYGFTQLQLTRWCLASPWMFIIGCGSVYSAIFAKLWRVHKVLQFNRVQISMKQAIWPIRLFLLASLITMSIWTILGEYEWKRTVVNDVTGESFGQCEFLNRTQQILFLTFEGFFLGVPIIMSLIWAWKTKDVDESFSEGSWIFVLIFVQLQTAAVGFPLFVILRDLSTNGRYLGLVLIMWMHALSSVLLIMLPKVLRFYGLRGDRSRGSRAHTRVTGIGFEVPKFSTSLGMNNVESKLGEETNVESNEDGNNEAHDIDGSK